ncbi:Hypothetical leucine rich repeat protein [Ectocarpus siliculosus]|uniref:Hypothetical leucine rich repeat protein n=1 Tax=Ectocarpus siliculosus TaxID=2880 RepID=D7G5C8_ECTSI|nr:Hypothetical leucine rich repeat protein [Ectocarpus siliculosus]|eukprot:CBJ27282.1 Hypothetical leucine rich repeat protein [Ectocarpus siliculosus]
MNSGVMSPEAIVSTTYRDSSHMLNDLQESLPKEIGGLKKLRRLDLANNRLEEIPDEASLLQDLEHVGLQGNPIQRMPLAIERLQTKGELLRSKARRQKLQQDAAAVVTSSGCRLGTNPRAGKRSNITG